MSVTVQRAGDLRNYVLVTGAYWADTIADGASRVLVLFYFYELGYSPLAVASLFLFYEFFGIVTNLVGGFLAARLGLKATLVMGLSTQIVALGLLGLAPAAWLVVPYVMASQALSGIAKDLTKMSSKSAVKLVVPEGDEGALFRWVAILTGSKNALKGFGFFLGGLLLTVVGFQAGVLLLAGMVVVALGVTLGLMRGDLGRPDKKARFSQMFSHNRGVNVLAGARIFLFASRDVWFVVGVPVFLRDELGWTFWQAGSFLAVWVIGYGIVQACAPRFVRRRAERDGEPDGGSATWLAFVLAAFPAAIAVGLAGGADPAFIVVGGLLAFGVIFAMNSAVHSYLILSYADGDRVAMNVGFYYMANAGGRLIGTVLSGLLYQWQGLEACLWASVAFVLAAGLLSRMLPAGPAGPAGPAPGPSPRLDRVVTPTAAVT
ncbi:MAG: MFS-type efflux pump ArsJ specific for 1-arseno-3-phosphoglycerate [uncultured Solirubrobacteraceae bacterium]|uniref:MFS-type efflux pump ArsJ specific for 1-arseno-3-phosphoglycerate n=1 Tax=uncultured Solirubrobacteraceae bacterium TaxID=1162706 RepID=A0A6J4SW51_9ACTN|nr:MAG: MFS-type efflux pump ArsJ specific for 1-arseno-3-phosphoglycerate [uncultured Solirubrobacteraceae bacterium]